MKTMTVSKRQRRLKDSFNSKNLEKTSHWHSQSSCFYLMYKNESSQQKCYCENQTNMFDIKPSPAAGCHIHAAPTQRPGPELRHLPRRQDTLPAWRLLPGPVYRSPAGLSWPPLGQSFPRRRRWRCRLQSESSAQTLEGTEAPPRPVDPETSKTTVHGKTASPGGYLGGRRDIIHQLDLFLYTTQSWTWKLIWPQKLAAVC